MPKLADWVRESVSGTPGTGTITLGGAYASNFIRCQDAYTTGDKVLFFVEDGNNRSKEIGTLTTGTPWTLSRDVTLSTIVSGTFDNTSPATLSLTSAAIVGIAGSADAMGIVVGTALATTGAAVSCTTIMPHDDTIPQITEGREVLTVAYTPKFSDSIIQVQAISWARTSANTTIGSALFKDAGANALVAGVAYPNTASAAAPINLYYEEVSGNTTSRTYRLRVGPNATGEITINGSATARLLGGVSNTCLKVTEIRQ